MICTNCHCGTIDEYGFCNNPLCDFAPAPMETELKSAPEHPFLFIDEVISDPFNILHHATINIPERGDVLKTEGNVVHVKF